MIVYSVSVVKLCSKKAQFWGENHTLVDREFMGFKLDRGSVTQQLWKIAVNLAMR